MFILRTIICISASNYDTKWILVIKWISVIAISWYILAVIFPENKFRIGNLRFSKIWRGRTWTHCWVQLLSSSLRPNSGGKTISRKKCSFASLENSLHIICIYGFFFHTGPILSPYVFVFENVFEKYSVNMTYSVNKTYLKSSVNVTLLKVQCQHDIFEK